MLVETSQGPFLVVEPSLRVWRLMLQSLGAGDRQIIAQAVNKLIQTPEIDEAASPDDQREAREAIGRAWDQVGAMMLELLGRAPDLGVYLLMGSLADPATKKRSLDQAATEEMTASDLTATIDALKACNYHKPFVERVKNWLSREAAKLPGA